MNKNCKYEYEGQIGLRAIGKKYGISPITLSRRICKGMSMEEAITTPVSKPKRNAAAISGAKNSKRNARVAVKKCDLMSDLWKMALGITA